LKIFFRFQIPKKIGGSYAVRTTIDTSQTAKIFKHIIFILIALSRTNPNTHQTLLLITNTHQTIYKTSNRLILMDDNRYLLVVLCLCIEVTFYYRTGIYS
jgi:hypothetical protein